MRSKMVAWCVLALLVPAGVGAAWSGKGAWEPSTDRDVKDGYMWLDVDDQPGAQRRVYFNGFTTQGAVIFTTALSPNSALLESALQLPSGATYAYLGVWKDCNGDGYIGSTDAHHRYPTALLGPSAVCPVTSTYPTHNDGNWVYEYIPITWNNETRLACCDANTFVDNQARVWMDTGVPEDVLSAQCATTSPPPNTYEKTGAALAWIDCETGYAGTGLINIVADTTGLSQLSFRDQPMGRQGESNSLLNQKAPVGNSEDASYVSAWDCSNGPSQTVSAPHPLGTEDNAVTKNGVEGVVIWNFTDDDGNLVWTQLNPVPGVPTVNGGGSFWGTVNETQYGPTDCDGTNGNSFSDQGVTSNVTVAQAADRDDCMVYCEARGYRSFSGRIQPTMVLQSEQWPENYNPDPLTQIMNQHIHYAGGLSVRQYWLGGLLPPQTFVTRNAEPAPAQFYTYYAMVSPKAIADYGLTMAGVAGQYGKEPCDLTAIDGETRFDCDPDNWWTNADGTPMTPSALALSRCKNECDPQPRVGDSFNARDIDCYDQAIGPQRQLGLTPAALFAGKGC